MIPGPAVRSARYQLPSKSIAAGVDVRVVRLAVYARTVGRRTNGGGGGDGGVVGDGAGGGRYGVYALHTAGGGAAADDRPRERLRRFLRPPPLAPTHPFFRSPPPLSTTNESYAFPPSVSPSILPAARVQQQPPLRRQRRLYAVVVALKERIFLPSIDRCAAAAAAATAYTWA